MTEVLAKALDAFDGTRGEVSDTPELRRLVGAPRRQLLEPDVPRLLTEILGGRGMELWPVQAEILLAVSDGGCFASVPVGEGKTPPSFLAITAAEADRAVLLVPAKLRDKTRRDFERLAGKWAAGPRRVTFDDGSPEIVRETGAGVLSVASYAKISTDPAFLEGEKPQLIILDEAHKMRSMDAGCTRRFVRYVRQHETRLLAMSGTVTSRSLLDFWHLLVATHGHDMPLPRSRTECAIWGRAVDEKVDVRARPGALSLLLQPGERPTMEACRLAVGRLWQGAPGVVHRTTSGCAASISARRVRPPIPEPARVVLRRMEGKDHIGPDGIEATPAEVWRHRRELALGFAYVWRDPAPEHWLRARKRWGRFARDVLERGDPRFDTEGAVKRGVREGELRPDALKEWEAVAPDFRPVSVAKWYGDEVLRYVADMAQKMSCAGLPPLLWVEHVAVGERLSKMTNWPYYREGSRDSRGNLAEDDLGGRPAILSIAACCDGLNLQYRWSQNVVLTPPPKGETCEQLAGRTHRRGQKADEVGLVFLCNRQDADLDQAIADAEYAQTVTGVPQKLLLADWEQE